MEMKDFLTVPLTQRVLTMLFGTRTTHEDNRFVDRPDVMPSSLAQSIIIAPFLGTYDRFQLSYFLNNGTFLYDKEIMFNNYINRIDKTHRQKNKI